MACDDIIACGTLDEHDTPLNPLQNHTSLQSPSLSRERIRRQVNNTI